MSLISNDAPIPESALQLLPSDGVAGYTSQPLTPLPSRIAPCRSRHLTRTADRFRSLFPPRCLLFPFLWPPSRRLLTTHLTSGLNTLPSAFFRVVRSQLSQRPCPQVPPGLAPARLSAPRPSTSSGCSPHIFLPNYITPRPLHRTFAYADACPLSPSLSPPPYRSSSSRGVLTSSLPIVPYLPH